MSTGLLDRDAALREIGSADAGRRRRAASSLSRWTDADVVRALAAAVADDDAGVRDAAGASLLMIGGAEPVDRLVPLLRSDDPGTRNRAGMLLERLGKAEPEALLRLSGDADPRMRLFAANILAGTGDHDLAPRLVELLADPDVNVRDAAVTGLGRMRASAAVPALRALLGQADPRTAFSVIDALGSIGSPAALRALVDGAPAAEPELRGAIVEAVAAAGSADAAAALMDLLSRFVELGPSVARALLGRLGPVLADGLERTPGLVGLLADELVRGPADDVLRALRAAAPAVREAGVEAVRTRRLVPAAPEVERLRTDPDPAVRAAAAAALAFFDRAGKERP